MIKDLARVATRVQQAIDLSLQQFDVDLNNITVRFDLTGTVAGQAGISRVCGQPQSYVRFNVNMIARGLVDFMCEDTVPHEIAHLVCMHKPKFGYDHDQGWVRVCRQLGGTGQVKHNQPVIYARGRTFEYVTTMGHRVRLSETRHRRVQAGHVYRVRGRGLINRDCQYQVIEPNRLVV